MTKTCNSCGKTLTSHGKGTQACRACRSVYPIYCQTCGKELPRYNRKTRQCRECWKLRGPTVRRSCQRCGKLISTKSRPDTKICRNCRSHPRPHCSDCGKLLARSPRDTKRCWSCWTKYRRQGYDPICMREDCNRVTFAKGLCEMHYRVDRRHGHGRVARKWIASHPCQLCNYAVLPSEVARIIPGSNGGKYELGNMVALCARCHREVEMGLTPCPPPLLP